MKFSIFATGAAALLLHGAHALALDASKSFLLPQFCIGTASAVESVSASAVGILPGSNFAVYAAPRGTRGGVDASCLALFTAPAVDSTVFLVRRDAPSADVDVERFPFGVTLPIDNMYAIMTVDGENADPIAVDAYFLRNRIERQVIYVPSTSSSTADYDIHYDTNALKFSIKPEYYAHAAEPLDALDTKASLDQSLNQTLFEVVLKQLSGESPLIFPNSRAQPVVTLKTRYSYSPDNEVAANFVAAHFSSLNYRTHITQFDMRSRLGAGRNIIAQCRGRTRPEEVVLIGAHFDCTSEQPLVRAPGAVDDGSGAAGVMTLAAAVAKQFPNMQETGCFDRTVVFGLFGGEEQGLLGSHDFVQQHSRAGSGVKGTIVNAILMDMIAYSKRFVGVKVEGTRDEKIQALMKTVEENMKRQAPVLTVELSSSSFGSDHVSFQRGRIPAVLLIEQDDTVYPNYHRSTDRFTAANVNMPQTMGILRGLAGSLVDLASIN